MTTHSLILSSRFPQARKQRHDPFIPPISSKSSETSKLPRSTAILSLAPLQSQIPPHSPVTQPETHRTDCPLPYTYLQIHSSLLPFSLDAAATTSHLAALARSRSCPPLPSALLLPLDTGLKQRSLLGNLSDIIRDSVPGFMVDCI
jgi:hypothetical protein